MTTELTLSQRIKILAKAVAGNPYRLSKEIGMAQPTINRYINQDGEPGTVFYAKVAARYPDVDLNWLITGRGSMLMDPAVQGIAEPGPGHQPTAIVPTAELEQCRNQVQQLTATLQAQQTAIQAQEQLIQFYKANSSPLIPRGNGVPAEGLSSLWVHKHPNSLITNLSDVPANAGRVRP